MPGKPLAPLLGMPMVGHCYYRTALALGKQSTYVATCDPPIRDYILSIGGQVIMTSAHHRRATTRTAEAMEHIQRRTRKRIDCVVMVQGDEPLIPSKAIRGMVNHLSHPAVKIVNLMSRFRTLKSFLDKNNVKVVVNEMKDAMYFSREPIPSPWKGWRAQRCYMQTGIIAFRKDALRYFNSLGSSELEKIESVDMNRVLEKGEKIRMVPFKRVTLGVDTPEDLTEAARLLQKDPEIRRYLLL